jgi:hypothetical protein
MATMNPEGIMALPAGGAPAGTGAPEQPQLTLNDSYDAVQEGLQNASPDAHAAVNAELSGIIPQLDSLSDEELDELFQIIQYLYDNPDKYAQTLAQLIADGSIEAGDLPEEHDPEFLATFGMILMQAKKSRQASQQSAPIQQPPVPPMGMARGGIAEAARMVASQGRGTDTVLAHINPQEAALLRKRGGMGVINPETGLPEYKKLFKKLGSAIKGVVKTVTTAVKKVVASPIGKVLATVAIATFAAPLLATLAPTALAAGTVAGSAATMAVASGAVTALGGGSLKDVVKSAIVGGATAFFGAPGGAVSNFVGGAVTNAAANAAITSGIVGTGIGLLSGQKLQDAVKSGLTAGAVSGLTTGFSKGFSSQIEPPKVGGSLIDAQAAEGQVKPIEAPTVQDQIALTNPDGSPRIEFTNGRPNYVLKNPDGSIAFKPVPFNERAYSDSGTVSAQPADASGASSYTGRTSGPAYDTGFGPGPPASATVGGRFDGVAPVEPLPPPVAGPYKPPTLMGSLKEMGGGISDIAQGDFEKGFGQLGTGAKNLFLPSTPSPSDVIGSQEYKDLIAQGISPDKALDIASKSMSPGMLRTYGPAVAAGLGVMGLAGGFDQKQPEPTALQKDMDARLQAERDRVAANPGDYVPKGMERFGIQYNEKGEIIGSTPFDPQPVGPASVAAKDYLADYAPPPTYNAPANAVGGGSSIYQPFNTASMYTNLMPPQYRADGGIASLARGGYPRRTGQISGPGTETSDSIPAMLSDGEFVMTAKAVRGAGKGNRLAGAKKMYALMHQLERNAARG